MEEVGHGSIVSEEYMNWRILLSHRQALPGYSEGDDGSGATGEPESQSAETRTEEPTGA